MLETGDVLLCRREKLLSRLIMRVTKGSWSHSALVIKIGNLTCIVEAQANGIHLKDYDQWLKKWGYKYEAYRTNKSFNKNDILHKAIARCGTTRYDFLTFIIRIPIRLLTGKNKDRRDAFKRGKKMICSEFTAWIWDIEINGTNEITPKEQHLYLKNSKDWDLIK